MIEVKVTPKGEGHNVMVAVNGNFKELVTGAFLAIGTICTGIRECGPLEGAIFDDLLKKAVMDKTSPLWNLNSADQTKITFDPSLQKK